MAITTLDGVVAGMKPPVPLLKGGITMAALGALRGYTPWYVAGSPGASVAATIGIPGQACTPALDTPTGVLGGRIPRTNPVSANAHLSRLAMNANINGTLWLIDRLWQNSGLSVTATTAQAITAAPALPARDRNGATSGDDVMAAMEWSAAGGSGTPTMTLTYTDQSGNAGASATLISVASPPAGTFEVFSLAAGDTGVRTPTSFINSVTHGAGGAMHLVLFRLLAQLSVPANVGDALDVLTSGMPRIYDDSVLQLVWFPSATTATNLLGTYQETQG